MKKTKNSMSMNALLAVKLHCEQIVQKLDKRIDQLERFKSESPYACELFHSYSEAAKKFNKIIEKIDSIENKTDHHDAELFAQLKKVNESFELVYNIKIKAPIDACFSCREERRRFVETSRAIKRSVRNIGIAVIKILHLDASKFPFFTKAAAHNEKKIKREALKSINRNEKLIAKIEHVSPVAP